MYLNYQQSAEMGGVIHKVQNDSLKCYHYINNLILA
jgi:hypothetical protein